MKIGKKCRHCGTFRVWRRSDEGALVPDVAAYPCAISPTKQCDVIVESAAAAATRQLAQGANDRAMGRSRGKKRN